MRDLLNTYLESTVEMRTMLAQRTPDEVAFDREVVAGLRKGWPIKKALKRAGEKHPNQALQWDDNTIADIREHYEWQLRHEDIMAKARSMGFNEEIKIPKTSFDAAGLSFIALDRILDEKLTTDPRLADDLAAKARGCLRFGRAMSDEQLIEKLRSFGVGLDKEAFAELRPRFLSAEELSNWLISNRGLKLDGNDDDWLWVCLTALWERWFPDTPSLEMIDDSMQEGYQSSEKGDHEEAIAVWLALWKSITAVMSSMGVKTLAEFDQKFRGTQSVLNWVQDVETELLNACWQTGARCNDRVRFCQEVIDRTAEDDVLMIENMRRGIGDSYACLGDNTRADALFDGWLKADPRWGWGWIGWSDCYGLFTKGEKDYGRAEEILKQGLEISGVRDRDDMLERLMQLYDSMGREDDAGRIQDQLEQEYGTPHDEEALETTDVSVQDNVLSVKTKVRYGGMGMPLEEWERGLRQSSLSPASSKKIGRNEPCLCGSGKKYKKCCGG